MSDEIEVEIQREELADENKAWAEFVSTCPPEFQKAWKRREYAIEELLGYRGDPASIADDKKRMERYAKLVARMSAAFCVFNPDFIEDVPNNPEGIWWLPSLLADYAMAMDKVHGTEDEFISLYLDVEDKELRKKRPQHPEEK